MNIETLKQRGAWLDAEAMAIANRDDKPARTETGKAQHSPLPWYAHNGSGYVMRSEPGTVERIADCTGTGHPKAKEAANAKLIVASVNHADSMARVLQEVYERLPIGTRDNEDLYGAIQTTLYEYNKAKGGNQ